MKNERNKVENFFFFKEAGFDGEFYMWTRLRCSEMLALCILISYKEISSIQSETNF